MYDITLLSSFHLIQGNCNPGELYKIIEKIQPEMIFEELSFDVFEIVYSAGFQPQTIEAITIKAYLKKYPILHFPVDNYPVNETDLLSDAQIIEDNSLEYRALWKQQLLQIQQNGYSFVNSDDCVAMLDRIRIIEETVLSEINDLKLLNEHKAEKALHDMRENEMLKAIYHYSKQYPFNKGLFICGAEHRKPLKQKIQTYETKESLKLNWAFYNDK